MKFKDYYKTLGVARTATAEEIKKAYRKLARQHHPDVSKAADATDRMVELNEANAVLSDPEKRVAYDTLGSEAQGGGDFHPPPNWDAGFEFAGADNVLHSDFFEQLFGRAAHGPGRSREPLSRRGTDHHAKIELDILDAYAGAERTIALRSARMDEGRVVNETRNLQVSIPKGVYEGQHIRLAGRGGPGSGGAPAGDLLLEVLFKADPRWRAEGRDVYQRVPVSPWEASLGATALVQTPGGETEVSLPACGLACRPQAAPQGAWHPGRRAGRSLP